MSAETILFTCPDCGRTIRLPVNSARHSTRCPECAKDAKRRDRSRYNSKRRRKKEEANKPAPPRSIEEIAALARERGINYGQMVALLSREEER